MLNTLRKIRRRMRPAPATPSIHTSLLPRLSMGEANRLLYQKRLMETILTIGGDVVECGVGNGKTLMYWAFLVHDERQDRHIWGFDSFEGFPEPTFEDDSPRHSQKGQWGNVSLPRVQELMMEGGLSGEFVRSQVTLVKGFFDESLTQYTGEKIAILHLDCDLYQSYLTALENLYPKVVPGGVVAFDEYMGTMENHNFPGAKKAVDAYFEGTGIKIHRDARFGKYYLNKPPSV